jgi:hypothetical protein
MLFGRQRQPFRLVFVAAAVPFLLFAFGGAPYGAFLPYAALAGLCILQIVVPTLALWCVIFAIYFLGGGAYLYVLVKGLLPSAQGSASNLRNIDGAAVAALTTVFLALVFFLWRAKPVVLEDRALPDRR